MCLQLHWCNIKNLRTLNRESVIANIKVWNADVRKAVNSGFLLEKKEVLPNDKKCWRTRAREQCRTISGRWTTWRIRSKAPACPHLCGNHLERDPVDVNENRMPEFFEDRFEAVWWTTWTAPTCSTWRFCSTMRIAMGCCETVLLGIPRPCTAVGHYELSGAHFFRRTGRDLRRYVECSSGVQRGVAYGWACGAPLRSGLAVWRWRSEQSSPQKRSHIAWKRETLPQKVECL